MPIYEYRCAQCGAHKEILQRISDAPLTDCPDCGKPALKKQISAAGFQLKGTGWYVTDFRNNGTKPAKSDKSDKADKADKPAETAKPDAPKTESKSATPAAATA